ncbi:MAG: nitroreductase family protein [Helicobacteraceae bacterium]|jgi:nitroreductase|nr:nitroreductase family protein [Helicobacteraceae bacterium]
MKEIFDRASIRHFQDRPIEEEKVTQLLKAAMQAPSAGNQQPWEFLVVTRKETKEALVKLCQYSDPLLGAPLGIVTLFNKKKLRFPQCVQQDMGAMCENILLEAVHLGIGGVWLAIAGFDDRAAGVKNYLNLPKNIEPYATIALGYPQESKKNPVRYDAQKVHYEQI